MCNKQKQQSEKIYMIILDTKPKLLVSIYYREAVTQGPSMCRTIKKTNMLDENFVNFVYVVVYNLTL